MNKVALAGVPGKAAKATAKKTAQVARQRRSWSRELVLFLCLSSQAVRADDARGVDEAIKAKNWIAAERAIRLLPSHLRGDAWARLATERFRHGTVVGSDDVTAALGYCVAASRHGAGGKVVGVLAAVVEEPGAYSQSQRVAAYQASRQLGKPALRGLLVGRCYLAGVGVGRSYVKAREQFEVAVKAKSKDAEYYLANMVAFGFARFEQDPQAAFRTLSSLATQGHEAAAWRVGQMYMMGFGTKKDLKNADRWLSAAVASGVSLARYDLVRLARATGRPAKEVSRLLEAAAYAGVPNAQHELGLAIAEGRRYERDPVLAALWLELAWRSRTRVDLSVPADARKQLDRALRSLSEDERARLDRLRARAKVDVSAVPRPRPGRDSR